MIDFPDIKKVHVDENGRIEVKISMARFERQFRRAQFELDSMVMTDMVPLMPMITSTFINVTKAMSASVAGTGWVYAAAPPYGRFLYKGKVMVSPLSGSTWAKYGEKKVLVSQYGGKTKAREDIQYTKTFHPGVTAEWFEAAKRRHGKKWIRLTKQRAGGGTNA